VVIRLTCDCAVARVFIPGLPFPGRPAFLIPGLFIKWDAKQWRQRVQRAIAGQLTASGSIKLLCTDYRMLQLAGQSAVTPASPVALSHSLTSHGSVDTIWLMAHPGGACRLQQQQCKLQSALDWLNSVCIVCTVHQLLDCILECGVTHYCLSSLRLIIRKFYSCYLLEW